MKLVDITVELRFDGKAVLVEDLRVKLFKKINPAGKFQVIAPPLAMQLNDKRIAITTEEARYGVSVQDKDLKRAHKKVESYVTMINEIIEYSKLPVTRLGIKTVWVQKYTGSMDELKQAYRDRFYVSNDILNSAIDYSLTLTLEADEFTINYITGPVGKDEPLQGVSFPVGSLDEANIYTFVDCFMLPKNKVALPDLFSHIGSALTIGQATAEQTSQVLDATS